MIPDPGAKILRATWHSIKEKHLVVLSSGRQRRKWLNGIVNSVDMSLSKLWEIQKDREAWRAADHGIAKSQHN